MEWSITVRPKTAALDQWEWVAVRADQENVLSSSPDAMFGTKEDAMAAAHNKVDGFEQRELTIAQNTVTEQYTYPGLPEVPEVPEIPEALLAG